MSSLPESGHGGPIYKYTHPDPRNSKCGRPEKRAPSTGHWNIPHRAWLSAVMSETRFSRYKNSKLDSLGERIILNAPREPAIGRIILKGLDAVSAAALITRSRALAIAYSSRGLGLDTVGPTTTSRGNHCGFGCSGPHAVNQPTSLKVAQQPDAQPVG